MRPSVSLTVPTCIGCGAMGTFGTCEGSCREQRRDLVRAAAAEYVSGMASDAHVRAGALRAVAEQLASVQPALGEWEAAYRVLQERARVALRQYPRPDSDDSALEEPAAVATTWWCPECGGIDAPQPCLGICIWRPIDWVDKDVYEQERERALAEDRAERRLRRLLRRIVSVTPRSGQWERSWRALQDEARHTLQSESMPTGPLVFTIQGG
jgi:hypothetical protein